MGYKDMNFHTIEASNITYGKWFAFQAIVGEIPKPDTLIVGVMKWSQVFTHDALTLDFQQKAITTLSSCIDVYEFPPQKLKEREGESLALL